MNRASQIRKYRWLAGSVCVWLLCAWVAQQPAPARKPSRPAPHRSAPREAAPSKPAVSGPTATTMLNADGRPVDPESGLVLDATLPIVKGQCTACHSSRLILQSHFDREKWIERIRWMQRTQKLWDLGETEPPILAYLTKYYGPLKTPFDGRRLPLPTPKWYSQHEH